jgi:alkylation response protein AidB-like acyl-CoA dehydrogenase
MKLTLTDDQVNVQESFRGLFAGECPTSLVRRFQADPDPAVLQGLWTSLVKTGFFGLGVPEEFGGEGGDLFDLGLVFMEAGRALCPTPVYSTVAFGQALLHLGSEAQRKAWVPAVCGGQLIGSVALWSPADAGDVRPRLRATRAGDGWRLDGTLEFVANADIAQELLVTAVTADEDEPERTLGFVVSPGQPGWSYERMQTLARDSQCVVHLDGVIITDPVRVLGAEDAGLSDTALHWVSNAMTALQTMEMMGGAQAVLDRTVDYLKTREQFNRPLASFQAVQHHIADMHIAIDGARLAAYQAVWWTARGQVAEREVAIAKLKCSQVYKDATVTAHQLHGGVGYMREFDLHLWTERAKSTELLGGSAAVQVRRLERVMHLLP